MKVSIVQYDASRVNNFKFEIFCLYIGFSKKNTISFLDFVEKCIQNM